MIGMLKRSVGPRVFQIQASFPSSFSPEVGTWVVSDVEDAVSPNAATALIKQAVAAVENPMHWHRHIP